MSNAVIEAPVLEAAAVLVPEAPAVAEVTPVVSEVVVAEEVRTKRVYNKRARKFRLTEQNAIIKSVKEIGLVATAAKFDTLPIRISAICKARKVKVPRGRRPNAKVEAAA
jgi:hypothetical protein